MNREEFFASLRQRLAGMPPEELADRCAFLGEMIDDRMEEGASESDAVASLGSVEDAAAQILAETPLTHLVKERVRPRRALRAWEIVLLVLGSPIWLSLLLAAAAVVLAVYVTVWAVIVSLYAADLALAAGCLGALVGMVWYLMRGSVAAAGCALGAAAVCAGAAIALFIGSGAAAGALLRLTRRFALWLKGCLVRKEETV